MSTIGPERRIAEDLLLFLDGRRVLFDPMTLEQPDQVAESVLQMRKRIGDDLEALPFDSKAVFILRTMRDACLTYLSRVPTPDHAHNAWPGAVNDLRAAIQKQIEELESAYKISMPGGTGRPIARIHIPRPKPKPKT
jgi:hypothetical protein